MKKIDNSEEAFIKMCKTAIILIIIITIIGISAVVLNLIVKGNADWYVPVKVVGGEKQ